MPPVSAAARPQRGWLRPLAVPPDGDPMPRRPRRPLSAPFPDLLPPARLARLARQRGLTPRPRQILRLLCRGLSNGQIAAVLEISSETVRKHTKVIYHSFGVSDRLELVLLLVHREILGRDEHL